MLVEPHIDIMFDGPPSEPGRFVEVEDREGMSIRLGRWVERGDGLWALRVTLTDITEAMQVRG